MRLNAVPLYIMLPCSVVIVALTSIPVKSHPPNLQGTYKLVAAASDDVNKAIEEALKGSGVFTKIVARKRLSAINVPYKQISIFFTKTEVSIAVDELPSLRTPIDGTSVDWTREDKVKLTVSTVWEGEKLKRTFKADAGQRINTYSICADGKTLTMQVSVTGDQLQQPLTYKLVYQRANK